MVRRVAEAYELSDLVLHSGHLKRGGKQAAKSFVHDALTSKHALAGVFLVIDVSQVLTSHFSSPRMVAEGFAVLGYFS